MKNVMIVYLKPTSGSAIYNLDKAKVEMEHVLGFRGRIICAQPESDCILMNIQINPHWDLPDFEKRQQITDWIKTKTKPFFRVQSIR
jgi:hypothetical protein